MTKHLKKISKYKPSILQGQLRFAAAQPRTALAVQHPYERMAFPALAMILVLLVGGYLYFVAASILNVMGQRQAIAQSSQLQSSVGLLEEQYYTLSEAASPQEAAQLGLSPITNTAYVQRPGNAAVVASSNTEI